MTMLVPLPAPFVNDAGKIQNLVEISGPRIDVDSALMALEGKLRMNAISAQSAALEVERIRANVPLHDGFRGFSIIDCKAGSRRSSHMHTHDAHYLYVMSGEMKYTEQRYGSGTIVKFTVHPGEMVFTGPMVLHWTEFPVETRLLSVSRLSRRHEEHELDVTRVPWLDEASANDAEPSKVET